MTERLDLRSLSHYKVGMHSTHFLDALSTPLLRLTERASRLTCALAPLLLAPLQLAPLLLACESGSVARECEPVSQTGCAPGQRCTLGEGSRPLCAPRAPEGLGEGAPCATSEECADELGCVSRLGAARCARFCERAATLTPAPTACAAAHPLALCALSLTDRDDIGLCLTPCDPLGVDASRGCGVGLTCDFSPDLPFTECRPEGAQGEWAPCGVGARCAAPLACALEGGEARCTALVAPEEGCPPATLRRAQPRASSPEGSPYVSCWPYVSAPQSALLHVAYRLSLAPVARAGTEEACARWGASAAPMPEGGLLEGLSRSLSALALEVEGAGAGETLTAVWTAGGALAVGGGALAVEEGAALPALCAVGVEPL